MDASDYLLNINQRLTRVKLRVKGDRIYIRGTFPPKPGDFNPKQYDISTGYLAVNREIRLAEALALEIEGLLIRDRFDWTPYLKGKQRSAETIADWIEKYEADHWNRIDKNPNSISTWKGYLGYFKRLPTSSPLTVDVLCAVAEATTKANSRSRERCCILFSSLARFAGLDPTRIKALYRRPKKEQITEPLPTDDQIVEVILAIKNPGWRWIFGVQATFGLRNHEVFRLDTGRITEGIVKVESNSKTGSRLVWACPMEWVDLFDLVTVRKPNVGIENRDNASLGHEVSRYARSIEMPWPPYRAFRDTYACRLAVRGVDVSVAARWMGHTVSTHCNNYLDVFQERHSQEVFEKLKNGVNTTKPQ